MRLSEEEYIRLFQPYENKWVAINEKRKAIVADGDSMIQVQNLLKKKKEKADYLKFVLPLDTLYAPASC